MMLEEDYDIPGGENMEPMDDGVDAFANVGQGLVGPHKTAMLQYWQQAIDDIERISDDGTDTDVFKSTVLPLARIKKVMKTDLDVKMISAEAPILFAKGCDIFITELTMRAWIHAEENKRRTLQRSDIAMAIQKSDVFDFLIDIIPREEAQPRRSHRVHEHPANDYSPQAGNRSNEIPHSTMASVNSMPNNMHQPMQNLPNGMPGGIPNNMTNGIPNYMNAGQMNATPMNSNPMHLNVMDLGMNHLNPQIPHQAQSHQPQMPHQAIPHQTMPHQQQLSQHQLDQDHLNQKQLAQNQLPHPPQQQQPNESPNQPRRDNSAHRHHQLNTLTDVANLNVDVNAMNPMSSLGTGLDPQMSSLPYPGMNYGQQSQNLSMNASSPYLEQGSNKDKGAMKDNVDSELSSKQANTPQNSPFGVKGETSEEASHFANELPFSAYNESVDVSPFGQNF